MLDRIRSDIQERLDQLLGEADKLRHALTALGSRDGAAPAAPRSAAQRSRKTPGPTRSRRASGTPSGAAALKQPATPKATAKQKRASRSAKSAGTQARTPSGATKNAVLKALAGGAAMTAGEVATATGIGRASVSTTLSRLSKTGEVTKADRGYSATKPADGTS